MTQYCKVGWHAGVGGNRDGIGTYMTRLDDAGRPFAVKAVDDVGLALEAASYGKASGVRHNVILRFTRPGGAANDVPDYNKTPLDAARDHWALVKASIGGQLDGYKDQVWVEPVNELDKNRADWLGWFALRYARLARDEGYKVAMFGMNAGEPEPAHWELPGMLAYLEECAAWPEQAAISLHEGKVGDMYAPPASYYPHLIGRFIWLYDVCDAHGIARPTTFLSEWAWSYNNMPEPGQAMEEVKWLAALAALFPTLRGIYLWNLAGGIQWADLPNKLQRLIAPVTEHALQTTYPDPPGTPPPPGGGLDYKSVYGLLPQDTPDDVAEKVLGALWRESKITGGGSHHEAIRLRALGLPGSKTLVYNPERWPADIRALLLAGEHEIRYLPGTEPPTPPPPDPAKIDLLPYLCGTNGSRHMLQYNWAGGGQHPVQTRLIADPAVPVCWRIAKGGQFEELWADDAYIYRGLDTSEGGGNCYAQYVYEGTLLRYGAPWVPRTMAVGETFTFSPHVIHYNPDGSIRLQGDPTNNLKLYAVHDVYHFPDGRQLPDVIELGWGDHERYFFARGKSLVAWQGGSNYSYYAGDAPGDDNPQAPAWWPHPPRHLLF